MKVPRKQILILKTSNLWERIKHGSSLSGITANNRAEVGKLQKCAKMEKQSLSNIFSFPKRRGPTASRAMDK